MYKAYAPASAANLSVGFDLLGAALKPIDGSLLGDEIVISANDTKGCDVSVTGRFAHKLPTDPKQNIVYQAYLMYKDALEKEGKTALDVHMELSKNLPVCSGLGSSAASVVAAVVALDAIHDNALGEKKIVELMGALEGRISGSIHYDNVAPCYYGGLQLIVEEKGIISTTLPDFDNWYWVSCFPGIKVSTSAARQILPTSYDRKDTITFGRHLATFVHACHTGDDKLAASVLTDVIAEPYRASLIPGFAEAREYGSSIGALATGISGSGSSVFSIFEDLEKANLMKDYLEKNFIANEDGFCHVCKVDRRGAYAQVID
ncbi:MAG: homoserine kinase [Succinatimonas hippei]|nr:homoserine kinase [Succinatimonas hippei]